MSTDLENLENLEMSGNSVVLEKSGNCQGIREKGKFSGNDGAVRPLSPLYKIVAG